ncbi:hypothetical protein DXA98_12205 [Lachnospiraceae bacterium OF09-6]|nr:hypothetical protein DXA98_12205 [Lachnospiraceae bacterium OF09-6]
MKLRNRNFYKELIQKAGAETELVYMDLRERDSKTQGSEKADKEEAEVELYAEAGKRRRKDICILDSQESYPVVDLEEVRETAKKGTRPEVSYDSGSQIMQMLNLSKQEAEEQTEGMPVFSQEKPFGTLAETIKNFPEKLREQGRQKVR